MKIEIKKSTYRGRPIIQLFDRDANEEYSKYPVISVGVRKVNAILAVIEELKEFANENKEAVWKRQ